MFTIKRLVLFFLCLCTLQNSLVQATEQQQQDKKKKMLKLVAAAGAGITTIFIIGWLAFRSSKNNDSGKGKKLTPYEALVEEYKNCSSEYELERELKKYQGILIPHQKAFKNISKEAKANKEKYVKHLIETSAEEKKITIKDKEIGSMVKKIMKAKEYADVKDCLSETEFKMITAHYKSTFINLTKDLLAKKKGK